MQTSLSPILTPRDSSRPAGDRPETCSAFIFSSTWATLDGEGPPHSSISLPPFCSPSSSAAPAASAGNITTTASSALGSESTGSSTLTPDSSCSELESSSSGSPVSSPSLPSSAISTATSALCGVPGPTFASVSTAPDSGWFSAALSSLVTSSSTSMFTETSPASLGEVLSPLPPLSLSLSPSSVSLSALSMKNVVALSCRNGSHSSSATISTRMRYTSRLTADAKLYR